jgi:hypothetical protein
VHWRNVKLLEVALRTTTTAIADDEEPLPAEEIAQLQHTCTETVRG